MDYFRFNKRRSREQLSQVFAGSAPKRRTTSPAAGATKAGAKSSAPSTLDCSLTAGHLERLMTSMKSLLSDYPSSTPQTGTELRVRMPGPDFSSFDLKTSPTGRAARRAGYRDGNHQLDAYGYSIVGDRHVGMDFGDIEARTLTYDKVWIDELAPSTLDYEKLLRDAYGGLKTLRKKDYEKLASAIKDIGDTVEQMFMENPPGRPDAAAIRELVAARIGLVLAQDNKDFDSFRFAAACKGEKA